MALNLERKKVITQDINGIANQASALVIADYRGLTSIQMTALRAKAREAGVHIQIVRNTLARRAFEDTQFECVKETLTGAILLAFSKEEPGSAARLLQDFGKENEKLKVTALSLGLSLLDKSQLPAVASLPNKEEALTKLACTFAAPMTKLVRTLSEPHAKLVRVLAALKDKKQSES